MKCYKRLIYKQFAQISGLCGPQFLSYLPKYFTHLCRALNGDATLVDRNCPPIWPPEINKKHLELTFFIKALPFHLRASIRAHKHIFYYSKWLNCWKSRGETVFSETSYFGVTHCENSEVQWLMYFRNEACLGAGNLYKVLFFIHLQPSVNTNS